jgi:hypothetical protein
MDVDSLIRELERPPTKDNKTVVNIIQLIIMLLVGLDSGKDLFDVFKFGSFSFIDLVKIVVNGLLFCGLCLVCYGYFKDERGPSKNGFLLFVYGLLGELILFVLDWLRGGFGIGSLIEFLFVGIFAYILFVQSKNF